MPGAGNAPRADTHRGANAQQLGVAATQLAQLRASRWRHAPHSFLRAN